MFFLLPSSRLFFFRCGYWTVTVYTNVRSFGLTITSPPGPLFFFFCYLMIKHFSFLYFTRRPFSFGYIYFCIEPALMIVDVHYHLLYRPAPLSCPGHDEATGPLCAQRTVPPQRTANHKTIICEQFNIKRIHFYYFSKFRGKFAKIIIHHYTSVCAIVGGMFQRTRLRNIGTRWRGKVLRVCVCDGSGWLHENLFFFFFLGSLVAIRVKLAKVNRYTCKYDFFFKWMVLWGGRDLGNGDPWKSWCRRPGFFFFFFLADLFRSHERSVLYRCICTCTHLCFFFFHVFWHF